MKKVIMFFCDEKGQMINERVVDMNSLGKIVSKKKCIQETANNRFEKYGINKKHDDVI
jgi:hypothetical protein